MNDGGIRTHIDSSDNCYLHIFCIKNYLLHWMHSCANSDTPNIYECQEGLDTHIPHGVLLMFKPFCSRRFPN